MQQKKVFSSGINSDSADEILGEGIDRYRLNCRAGSSDNGNEGAIETTNGNTLISFTLPSGTNKCIGTIEDKRRKKVYYMIYNDQLSHRILEFNAENNVITLVMAEAVAAPYILNFQIDNLITGINVVELDENNHLLYWTDNWVDPNDANIYNEPKKINIEKSIFYSAGDYVNGYKFPFEPLWAYRIKQPPLCPPTYAWSGIGDFTPVLAVHATSNMTSTITTSISALPYNLDIASPGDNYNPITYAWTAQSDGLIDVIIKSEYEGATIGTTPLAVLLTANGTIIRTQLYSMPTSPPNSTYTTTFTGVLVATGDQIRACFGSPSNIGIEAYPVELTIYTIPPETAGTVNRLLNKLFQFRTQFVYDDNEISAWSPISKYIMPVTTTGGGSGQSIDTQDNLITISVPTGSGIVKRIRIAAKNVGQKDFSLIADIDKEKFGISDDTTYDYEFSDFGGATPIEVNESNKLYDYVPLRSQSQEFFDNRIGDGEVTEGFDPVEADLRLAISYDILDTHLNTFFPAQSYLKSGGKYNTGVVYYDEAGNRSGLTNATVGRFDSVNDGGKYGTSLYIPFVTEADYAPSYQAVTPNLVMSYVPLINMTIYNKPPKWATHYQIVRSKNEAIGRYIQFAAQDVVGYDTAGNALPRTGAAGLIATLRIYLINITQRFSAENPNSHLVYDFIPGDRLRIMADVNYSDYPTPAPIVNSEIQAFYPYTDVVVGSYNAGGGYIEVVKTDNIPTFSSLGNVLIPGCLFEIYQPNNVIDEESELIYEIGECRELAIDSNGDLVHEGDIQQLFGDYTSGVIAGATITLGGMSVGHGFSVGDACKIVDDNGFNVFGTITISSATSVELDTAGYTIFGTTISIGYLVRGADVRLVGGDTFRRLRNMPYLILNDIYRLYHYIEDAQASDVFSSYADNIGRPNRIDDDFKQITHISTVRYSEQLIPNTFINGLSSVFEKNFEEYNQNFGGIKKLYSEEQNLIMFQELKCSRIPVNQIIYNDLSLSQTVGASPVILSDQPIYYAGEFGIGNNPESFAVYGNAKYFVDVRRGAALRLSIDGITPISDTSFMHNYFTDKCELMLKSPRVKVYGVWDKKFNEYVVAFESFALPTGTIPAFITYPAETLAFNEKYNIYSTFYSYGPDFMCTNGINIVSIKDGNFYTHNTNSIQNNFYGVQYTSEIWSVLNDNPSNVKVFEAISEETNSPWEVYEIITPNGQSSNLIEADFQMKEFNQYAPLWKDENTPNVGLPLIEGDVMRDRTFMCKFRYNGTEYNKIFAVNFNYIISNLHNK